jgi:hypothetical protein
MTMVQNLGYSLSSSEGCGIYYCAPVYIPYKEDRTSVGHRVHVKPVLEVSWFYFPAVLMTRLNVTFSFWQILKIDTIKAQLLWVLLRPFIAGLYAFSEDWKKMHDTCLLLFDKLAWQNGKKEFTKSFHILRKYCA